MCICFSPMGTQLKESHPQFESHESYYKKYSKVSDVMVVENVVEYGAEIAKKRLGENWEVRSIHFDPRNLGMGVARARLYMLCWNKLKVVWDAPYDLAEFLDALASQRVLTAIHYFWQKRPCSALSDADDSWSHHMSKFFWWPWPTHDQRLPWTIERL